MPLAFPSHQGLILPLWARWPERFNGLALCIGAATPDIVDGAWGLLRRDMGQGLGHSLVGQFVLCVPAGLAVTWFLRAIWRPNNPKSWKRVLDNQSPRGGLFRDAGSVLVGSLSHIVFDFFTHGNFLALFPWYEKKDLFPAWWYHEFGRFPVPLYREPYPIATHFLVWLAFTVLGAIVFVRTLRRQVAAVTPGSGGAPGPSPRR
ncbi:MAG TPA: DUF4184 family protein [Planctomycetota bacterium]|jgi:hypothetical protein|nr:DUF4184 family protein [Planctomycetota bacterium]